MSNFPHPQSLFSLLRRLLACSLCLTLPSLAQIPLPTKTDEKPTPASANPSPTDPSPLQKLEKSLKEVSDLLHRIEVDPPPQGIDPSEAEARKQLLEQSSFLIRCAIKDTNTQTELQKKVTSSTEAESSWQGFAEPPPYSILTIDQLINEYEAIHSTLISLELKLNQNNNQLSSLYSDLKNSENELGQAAASVDKASPDQKNLTNWRLLAAKERFAYHNYRIQALSAQTAAVNLTCQATRADLKLIERKIAAARHQSKFLDSDLAKLQKIRDDRKAAYAKEVQTSNKRLPNAIASRDKIISELNSLKDKSPQNTPAIQLAELKLEAFEELAASTQFLKDGFELLKHLENSYFDIYQTRKNYLSATTPEAKSSALEELKGKLSWLNSIKNSLVSEQQTQAANLRKIETRQAGAAPTSPEFSLFNDLRSLTNERLALLDRSIKSADNQITLTNRWCTEFTTPTTPNAATLTSATHSIFHKSYDWIQKGWNFKLSEFKEFSMEIDGKTITKTTTFTLGMLVKAILFFLIGYRILSYLLRRVESILIHRGFIAETQASTLRNWAMIIACTFLLIGTFSLLNIPLTVFAFLGGALAIGLGFGTQTIIKNFISGIILLVERKVRVGDILEVDGFIGKVTEINTRSSVIRSGDDVETIVPNSVFLENRVTNWTLSTPKIRKTLQIGVAYGTQPQVMIDLLTESAERHGLICKDPAPFAILNDFADNALVFQLYYWLDLRSAASGIVVASDLRLMIEKRLSELAIDIPFPQRNLHLNSKEPLQVTWAQPPTSPNP